MHGIPAHSAVLQEDPSHATIVVYRTHPAVVFATAVVQRWASVEDAGPALDHRCRVICFCPYLQWLGQSRHNARSAHEQTHYSTVVV